MYTNSIDYVDTYTSADAQNESVILKESPLTGDFPAPCNQEPEESVESLKREIKKKSKKCRKYKKKGMSETKKAKKLKREIKSMKRRVRDINKKRQDELQKQRIREIAETAASVSKVVAGELIHDIETSNDRRERIRKMNLLLQMKYPGMDLFTGVPLSAAPVPELPRPADDKIVEGDYNEINDK